MTAVEAKVPIVRSVCLIGLVVTFLCSIFLSSIIELQVYSPQIVRTQYGVVSLSSSSSEGVARRRRLTTQHVRTREQRYPTLMQPQQQRYDGKTLRSPSPDLSNSERTLLSWGQSSLSSWPSWSSVSQASTIFQRPIGDQTDESFISVLQNPQRPWRLAEQTVDQSHHIVDAILPPPSLPSWSSRQQKESDVEISTCDGDGSNVLVFVMSHVDHVRQREVIRNTWGSTSNDNERCRQSANVVFVVGSVLSSNKYDVSTFQEEQTHHQDLLEIPILESYDKLSEKLIQAYSWAAETRGNEFDWIVKVDDDMFVDVQLLGEYLRKFNPRIPMLIGNLVAYSKVQTDGKWKDVEFLMKQRGKNDENGIIDGSTNSNEHYPYWAKGCAGHVISRAALVYITNSSSSLRRYQGEDTSLGIWLDDGTKNGLLSDMTYIHSSQMFVSLYDADLHGEMNDVSLDGLESRNSITIGHKLGPNEIEGLWSRRRRRRRSLSEKLHRVKGKVWIGDLSDFETTVEREELVERTTEMIRNTLVSRRH